MIRASKNFRNRLSRLIFHTGRICCQSNISESSKLYYSHVWVCLEQLRNIIDFGIESEYLQTKEEFKAELERGDDKDLDSKIFAWKIYDEDDGEEEIYIEIEKQDE